MTPATLEAMLMLLGTGLGGRRRGPLNPKSLLVDGPKSLASKAIVASAASHYAKEAQRIYAEFFGQRKMPGRQLDWLGPADLAKRRDKLDQPKLHSKRKSNPNSEGSRMKRHAAAVEAVASGVGGSRKSLLGGELPEATLDQGMNPLLAAARSMLAAWESHPGGRKSRALEGQLEPNPDSDDELVGDAMARAKSSAPSAPASASASAAKPTVGRFAGNVAAVRKACVDNGHSGKRKLEVRDVAAAQQPPLKRSKAEKGSVAEQALAKQAKVAALKRQALVSSTPTVPTAYVDAQGGRMKPRSTAVRKNAPMPPKPLPDTPGSALVRLSQGNRELPLGAHARFIAMTEVDKDKPPDIVLVSDLLKLWESHYALIARLFGARASWTCAGCSPTGAGATALPSIQRSVWATSFT